MFAPEWQDHCREQMRRKGLRSATFKSIVYENPKTGAMLRTRPAIYRRQHEFNEMLKLCRDAGYKPCYANTVTMHV